MKGIGNAAIAAMLGVAFGAHSQSTVTIPSEYGKLLQSRTAVASLGSNLFGDEVNLYDGSLQFSQTDVSLPGNSPLQVGVGRRFNVRQDEQRSGLFADWDIEIPHLYGTFSASGWVVPGASGSATTRCTQYGPPPGVTVTGGSFSASEFWAGSFLVLPGGGGGELLKRLTATPVPTDGQTYPLTTRDGVVLRCLPSLASTSSGSGEGFEALTPDGTRYRFDQMTTRFASRLFKSSGFPESMAGSSAKSSAPRVESMSLLPDGYMMDRREAWIMPTLITDRHGNTVTYTWDTTTPSKLLSIVASDGRSLTFTYVTGTNRVASVSDGAHTWNYVYQQTASNWRLSKVNLPDGSSWTFDLEPLRLIMGSAEGGSCSEVGSGYPNTGTGTITHPSGAQGSFSVAETTHGRSHVPLQCVDYDPGLGKPGYAYHPDRFAVPSLTSKSFSGPGLSAQNWTYSYGPTNDCFEPSSYVPEIGGRCTASSPTTKQVSVTAPDGAVTRYTFGNYFRVNEGQLLQIDEGWNGSSAAQTTVNTYAPADAGPYPNPVGSSVQPRNDGYVSSRHMPLKKRTITRQGRTFTWQVDATCGSGATLCFDNRARPTKVTKNSGP